MESLPVSFVYIETQSLLHIHLLAIFSVHIIHQLHGHTCNMRQIWVLYEPSVFVSHLYPVLELDHIQWAPCSLQHWLGKLGAS
jgi:hypothetical protein